LEQRNTRPQLRKKNQDKPEAQRDAVTSDDSSTETEDLDTAKLVKELVKLRREIRRRDELHKEELQKLKKSLALPSQKFDTSCRPLQIDPRRRNPTPSLALRTATMRSSVKFNPCAL
jgi:TATA-binding protein-associated factor Taf7